MERVLSTVLIALDAFSTPYGCEDVDYHKRSMLFLHITGQYTVDQIAVERETQHG